MPSQQIKPIVVAKIIKKRGKAHACVVKEASCGGEDKQEKRENICPDLQISKMRC